MSDSRTYMNDISESDNLQLPTDVIIHILSYLSTSDRLSARLVNQSWHEASLVMKFLDQEQLVLGQPCIDNLNEVIKVLQHSTRPFYNFVFKEVELKRNMSIWDQYGPYMKSLILLSCDLSEKTFVEIFKCCKSLKVLRISGCRECLISGRLLEDESDIKELSETLKNVQELSLDSNRFLSDTLFNRLVAICPNLESLSLMHCEITFFRRLSRNFYPLTATLSTASKSVLTFLNIFQYVKQQAHKLKHLNFGYTLIDGAALATLSTLQDLRLESLILQGCCELNTDGIQALSEYQTCLKVLDISYSMRITDASLFYICRYLTKLETLKIRRCYTITNCGVKYIRLLENLKELDISESKYLTSHCITRGLCFDCNTDDNPGNIIYNYPDKIGEPVINKNMRILTLNALNLDEQSIICITKSFPNLSQLELNNCIKAVTDRTIQIIFKELVHLRVLKVSSCNFTDNGLTGVKKKQVVHKPESRLRISLRSKAEEEIVRDADRKRETIHLCDICGTMPLYSPSGFSLSRLKCLQELDLSANSRISDVTLKSAFAFPELKILNLSRCQKITHVGLDYLSKNNPAIECLNLSNCYNISDIGISYIAQRLHRLKRLLLEGCSQLTDHSLEYIKVHCKSLQYLDTRYCRRMTVAGLESLTHLYVVWPNHVEGSAENEMLPSALLLRYLNSR